MHLCKQMIGYFYIYLSNIIYTFSSKLCTKDSYKTKFPNYKNILVNSYCGCSIFRCLSILILCLIYAYHLIYQNIWYISCH